MNLNDMVLQIFNMQLPADAVPIYFRDMNGNISTSTSHFGTATPENSNIISNTNSKDPEEIVKVFTLINRYPIMGGWTAEFEYGYSLPLKSVASMTASNDKVKLQAPFGVPEPNVAVKHFELNVVLPEGATDITVKPPYKVSNITVMTN